MPSRVSLELDIYASVILMVCIIGGSFNTFLDALDASYCTYEGGDDQNEDPTYPDVLGGYDSKLLACPTRSMLTSSLRRGLRDRQRHIRDLHFVHV